RADNRFPHPHPEVRRAVRTEPRRTFGDTRTCSSPASSPGSYLTVRRVRHAAFFQLWMGQVRCVFSLPLVGRGAPRGWGGLATVSELCGPPPPLTPPHRGGRERGAWPPRP